MTNEPCYQIVNLSAEYKKNSVLKDISFQCSGGKFIGIVGANGAGKTTLVRIMAGLFNNYIGSVRINSQCLSTWGKNNLACERGYLPQKRNIYWPLTVEKVLELGRLQYGGRWNNISGDDSKLVSDVIQETGIEDLRFRKVDSLSGGELAQVLLARVLVGRPRIILADEPISGLDPSHSLQVMESLQGLALKGCLVLCVIHDLVLASRFCDRLILLHNGMVLADGDPQSVLSEKNLDTAYGVRAIDIISENERATVPWSRVVKSIP